MRPHCIGQMKLETCTIFSAILKVLVFYLAPVSISVPPGGGGGELGNF